MHTLPARRAVILAAVLAVLAVMLVAAAQAASAQVVTLPLPKPPAPPAPPVDHCALAGDEVFGSAYYANERAADQTARAAERWLRRHAGARKALAGRWFSVSSRHGVYHLAFTRAAAAYERSLRRAVPHPERMCVSPALYTLRELYAAQDRIERDRARLKRAGVVMNELGAEVETNSLVVGIGRSSGADAAQVLRRRYGGLVALRVEFAEPAQALDH